MASPCTTYHPSPGSPEDDSMMLFSTSTSCSPAKESTRTHSNSSSFNSSSPPPPPQPSPNNKTYELRIRNLSYTISPNSSIFSSLMKKSTMPKTSILKSVSFVAGCSEILAIVGPSGTGKSTLLRVISGRVSDKEFDPKSIYLNDHAITSPAQLRNICGYVAQEDNLLPLLTVKETLMFSAKFRLRGMSPKEREERVESLMQELGLDHVADNFVGDEENRGISGGERKRVSIGVDMIHDPPLLLLDEPTSGLDSSSALQVIELLSSMAKTKQRTIILSIHQPSYRILQYISNLLILSHGSVVHYGSLESLEENISGMGYEIPIQLNPLEFAMEIISVLENQEPHSKYQSCSYLRWKEAIIQDGANKQVIDQAKAGDVSNARCSSLFEIAVLCSRFWKIIYRTKQLFLARTMQALVGGFGLGSVYIKMRNDEGTLWMLSSQMNIGA